MQFVSFTKQVHHTNPISHARKKKQFGKEDKQIGQKTSKKEKLI